MSLKSKHIVLKASSSYDLDSLRKKTSLFSHFSTPNTLFRDFESLSYVPTTRHVKSPVCNKPIHLPNEIERSSEKMSSKTIVFNIE